MAIGTTSDGETEAALYEVAYEEATRALSEQLTLVDGFRTRAGLLLSAAAITTSVLGSQALARNSLGFASWVALASLFSTAMLSLGILWSRPREFGPDSLQIIRDCIEGRESRAVVDLHRALTLRMQRSYAANRQDLARLAFLFEAAGALLAIEILSWILATTPIT